MRYSHKTDAVVNLIVLKPHIRPTVDLIVLWNRPVESGFGNFHEPEFRMQHTHIHIQVGVKIFHSFKKIL